MVITGLSRFSALLLLLLPVTSAYAQAPASTLPGGATSLQETYQDWQVSCAQQATTKRCAFSQRQTQQNGQLVLAIELQPGQKGTEVVGTLLAPFGLDLASGITLQPEQGKPLSALRFKTCVALGCIVPMAFDAAVLTVLQKTDVLNISAIAADSSQPVQLRVSLKGFTQALERTIDLSK